VTAEANRKKGSDRMISRSWQLSMVIPIAAALMLGCDGGTPVPTVAGGSVDRGRQVIIQYRCGSCHTIPGIHGAHGVFGPPLALIARQTTIAGNFPNQPANLVRWVMAPTSMKPKTAMPDLGLSEQQARDAAAYLYTLR
jgi:cytochrome c